MRPSDLLMDFGKPVAYYPGLVKVMGSVNAVILFCQLFYWTGKEQSELGIHKETAEIEAETGLSYEAQLTARKQLKKRGILVEVNKRLEHRIYYRINTERLDKILSQVVDLSPNGQSPIGETEKAKVAKSAKPNPPSGQSLVGGDGKAHFVHTENTTENTSDIANAGGVEQQNGVSSSTVLLPEQQQEQSGPTPEKIRDVFWQRFDAVYFEKYACTLPRNAKTNSQVKQLIQRLGKEAPAVACFYVQRVTEPRVVMASHTLDFLLVNAEGYRSQWLAGRANTLAGAMQADKTQTNANVAERAIARLLEREAAKNGG